MVEVRIDGSLCDFTTEESISLGYKSSDLVDLESGRSGSTIEFRLPLNSTNCAILGVEGDVHPERKFNEEWHSMTLELDKVTLFEGTAYLMRVEWSGTQRYIVMECRGGVLSWAESAATTLFKNIDIDYSNTLTEANIKASWADDSPIKFFPITRDIYEAEGSSSDVSGVRVLRTIDDYHPFIQLSALFEAIFSSAGYTIKSSTIEEEMLSQIYISGSYSSEDNEAAQESMGFYVKRGEDSSTVTDSMGRISLSPYDVISTVGNIVDTSTIESDSECYNHGNVLQVDGEALIFKPLTSISVGFEYYLHYTCDCSIASRTALRGVNCLNTMNNGVIDWEITNRYIDQRDQIVGGVAYKVVIFDFEDGEIYRLYAPNSSGGLSMVGELSERMSSVVAESAYSSMSLYRYNGEGYDLLDEDQWAIYFGYVSPYTPTEVKVTVRSSPKEYSPTSPMRFELQMLDGADAGVNFTLHGDSSVRPYFSAYPGCNSTITFEDIAQHSSVTALDFLSSMQHLFNLRFLTNEAEKSVTIESFDNLYNGQSWDWSEKIVEGSGVTLSDLAHTTFRTTTYGYQQSDGVVQRMGQSDNLYFGEWSYHLDSYAASSGSQTLLNPLLSASTNDEDGVLVVGDRDDLSLSDSLDFSPRIARYFRMIDVEGENYSLPYISFHSPDDGFTLCFEDRDGVQGLNRLYRGEVELLRRSQILSLTLSLTALDYSNLFEPNELSASVRSIFNFDICGESFRTLLYSIEGFDPESGEAKCKFLTLN